MTVESAHPTAHDSPLAVDDTVDRIQWFAVEQDMHRCVISK